MDRRLAAALAALAFLAGCSGGSSSNDTGDVDSALAGPHKGGGGSTHQTGGGMAGAPRDAGADLDASTSSTSDGGEGIVGSGPADAGPAKLAFGANVHANGDYGNGDPAAIAAQFALMQARGLGVARVGGVPADSSASVTAAWATAAASHAIHLEYMLDVAWTVCPRDAATFATNDQSALYTTSYQAVYAFVSTYRDSITDWEIGNEIDLKAGQSAAPGLWNTGWAASDWSNVPASGSADYFGNWAATLKGAADAIGDINTRYGTHLRRVLNVTSTHTGFLDFMEQQGVSYEVLAYHYYYAQGVSPYALSASAPGSGKDSWDVFAALGAYHRPVTIDEMNCAEIYQDGYANTATDPLYATCLTNLRAQMGAIAAQSEMNLESLVGYELLDEPSQAAPEDHFGLFWNDLQGGYTPKAHALLWSAFAGGTVSAAEQKTLASFGLLPLP